MIDDDIIKKELGISYEEFEMLDFLEQQKLIKEKRKKKMLKGEKAIMIGYGEHSIFTKSKKIRKL